MVKITEIGYEIYAYKSDLKVRQIGNFLFSNHAICLTTVEQKVIRESGDRCPVRRDAWRLSNTLHTAIWSASSYGS